MNLLVMNYVMTCHLGEIFDWFWNVSNKNPVFSYFLEILFCVCVGGCESMWGSVRAFIITPNRGHTQAYFHTNEDTWHQGPSWLVQSVENLHKNTLKLL